jgi:integrase
MYLVGSTERDGTNAVPKLKLTKSIIDALPTPTKDTVYWDATWPGFGLKVTPKGRKVFIVLYRVAGGGTRVRKYTIGPHGRVTVHQARIAAQRVFTARLEGRDPAAEKQLARRRHIVDRIDDLVEAYIVEHVSKTRTSAEIASLLRREVVRSWGPRSVHDLKKREIIDLVMQTLGRGTPAAANKLLKQVKRFLSWCVGRAILETSPAQGLKALAKEVARDRVLTDEELTRIICASRQIGYPYGHIVELLALTGQRREEIAASTVDELDLDGQCLRLPGSRTKNGKPHVVHLSAASLAMLEGVPAARTFLFSFTGVRPFQNFSVAKRELDKLSGVTNWRLHDLRRTCVSGMARLGVPPHVADKILNHQTGTISGVAAVYQRHDFLAERKDALDRWGCHVAGLVTHATRKAA